MITIPEFYRVCERLGFRVFKDYPYNDFYKIFYDNNNEDMGHSMARLIKFTHGNAVVLFKPINYSIIAPSTGSDDKTYSDIKEFEKALMDNYFEMKKYWFDYYMREHSLI